MPSLKTINIGSDNMRNVRNFTINGFESLETISINTGSFRSSTSTQKSGSEVNIRNCHRLNSVWIGDYAFADFQRFTISNLTSLESLTTTDYSLSLTTMFELSGK